jgi:hypothetical protein
VIEKAYSAVRRVDNDRFAKEDINTVRALLLRQPLEQGQGRFHAFPAHEVREPTYLP